MARNNKPTLDFSGLNNLYNAPSEKAVLKLPLESVIEDPNQPRKYFDEESIQSLAESIKDIGLLQPILVRPKNADGIYIIIAGARRYRAHKLLKVQNIEAIVKEDGAVATAGPQEEERRIGYAQMNENMLRENLDPREMAAFIMGEIALGVTKAEIASGLKRSPGFVTAHVNLAEAPSWIQDLSGSGKCSDVFTLSELSKLDKAGKIDNLQAIVSDMPSISRSDVKRMAKDPASAAQEIKAEESKNEAGQQEQPPATDTPTVDQSSQEQSPAPEQSDSTATNDDAAEAKPKKSKEPSKEIEVFVDGKRAFVQSKSIQVYFPDTDSFESVPTLEILTSTGKTDASK